MKIKHIPFVILSLCFFGAGAQQPQEQKLPLLKASDVYLLPGVSFYRVSPGSQEIFQDLAPHSTLLQEDYTDHSRNPWSLTNGNSAIDLMLGFKLANRNTGEYHKNMQLRLGISYASFLVIQDVYQREDTEAFDTLTSSRTGQQLYVDSVFTSYYNMNHAVDQLSITASMIWRTNPEARWSLYAGAGISAGITIKSTTTIMHSESTRLHSEDFNSPVYGDDLLASHQREEIYGHNNSFGFSFYTPVGVDWRIGKTNKLLQRLHIFYEARPSIDFHHVPEQKLHNRPSIFQGFGLRFS